MTRPKIPMTLEAAFDGESYAAVSHWPVSYGTLRQRQNALTEELVAGISQLVASELRDILTLVVVQAGWLSRVLANIADHATAAQVEGEVVDDGYGCADYLLTGDGTSSVPLAILPGSIRPIGYAWARTFMRTAIMNSTPTTFVRALTRPGAIAVSHNPLMIDYARLGTSGVRFRHADSFLIQARDRAGASTAPRPDLVEQVLAFFEERLARCFDLPEAVFVRLIAMFRVAAQPVVEAAAHDLEALQSLPWLPETLWSGSAGAYATRALAIAVRRRGGVSVGFDHGGTASLVDDRPFMTLFELGLRQRYVMPTAQAAHIQEQVHKPDPDLGLGGVHFEISQGDPTFRRVAALPQRPKGRRARILYVVTTYGGLWHRLPPLLPDLLAVGIQRQVLKILRRLDAEIQVRPHPETKLNGRPHPLANDANFASGPFRETLAAADILVFDYPQTTTLWETACTDRPIILIDSGIAQFNALARDMIDRRIHRVSVQWEENGLPTVPQDAFHDAIESALPERADPSEFLSLLAGIEAA